MEKLSRKDFDLEQYLELLTKQEELVSSVQGYKYTEAY
jgi:hypothetical protein